MSATGENSLSWDRRWLFKELAFFTSYFWHYPAKHLSIRCVWIHSFSRATQSSQAAVTSPGLHNAWHRALLTATASCSSYLDVRRLTVSDSFSGSSKDILSSVHMSCGAMISWDDPAEELWQGWDCMTMVGGEWFRNHTSPAPARAHEPIALSNAITAGGLVAWYSTRAEAFLSHHISEVCIHRSQPAAGPQPGAHGSVHGSNLCQHRTTSQQRMGQDTSWVSANPTCNTSAVC